jgi:hypothetical protein
MPPFPGLLRTVSDLGGEHAHLDSRMQEVERCADVARRSDRSRDSRLAKRCGEVVVMQLGRSPEMADTLGLVANTPLVQNTRVFQQRERCSAAGQASTQQRNLRLHCFEQLKGGTGHRGIKGRLPQSAEKSAQPSIRTALISMQRGPGCTTSPAQATPHQPVRRITHRRSPDPCIFAPYSSTVLGEARQGC